jgi:hypothetical protein
MRPSDYLLIVLLCFSLFVVPCIVGLGFYALIRSDKPEAKPDGTTPRQAQRTARRDQNRGQHKRRL